MATPIVSIDAFKLDGQVALVTGASRGLGAAIACGLASAGADVALHSNEHPATATAEHIAGMNGRRTELLTADLADRAAADRLVEQTLTTFGRIDILVNNAGVALIAPLLAATVEDWDMTMAVNLRAPFLLAKALAPMMISQRAGKIVNVSSQAGVIGLDGHGAYAASKGGLNMLTKIMMTEWARHNIQVNAVCPTIILTPMGEQVWGDPAKGKPMLDKTPLGRFGKPVEVADLILYLSSSASDLINGECVMIDAGYSSV